MGSCSISIGGIELIINFKKFLTDGNHENFLPGNDRDLQFVYEAFEYGQAHFLKAVFLRSKKETESNLIIKPMQDFESCIGFGDSIEI